MGKCELISKCPIYNEILDGNRVLISSYKNLYCEDGEEGKIRCRRYQVFSKLGYCPPEVLPNSRHTAEEIIARIKT